MLNCDLNDLMVFATVVEKGSFTAAAEAYNTPKSNVSRKITRLETHLGVRLLERSTRSLRLTEVGQRYYEYCRRIKDELNAADSAVESMLEKPQGRLRICTSLGVGQSLLSEHLANFCLQHPDIELDLALTNRRVDLIEEGFDLAFRMGDLADSSLVAKRLCEINLKLYAAPDRGFEALSHPSNLLDQPLMLMSAKERSADWQLTSKHEEYHVSFKPSVRCDDFSMLKRMAVQGLGITELPDYMAKEFEINGKLINVLPDWSFKPVALYALYPSHRGATPKVRSLLEYLNNVL
ncbi:LysR family transcriptional regulator [Vibrio sinaloensis DSM 21326]|uniref:LysR family transcriptional regulator n=1 Tax=Vibrio sinaloensis DSM 21326 TaxID=945550 RepID=E8M6D6_PHOS4|nr:LysR family transcriptional regulator [Vibrio sinaloensis]EGA70586.1 LysR family transcriptional regulator [Vibrio sinaloensis DSM 21326]